MDLIKKTPLIKLKVSIVLSRQVNLFDKTKKANNIITLEKNKFRKKT